MLLDGGTGVPACERAGVPVVWETVVAVGARDASLVVASFQRRRVDESRRALGAAKLANFGAGRPDGSADARPAAWRRDTAPRHSSLNVAQYSSYSQNSRH